MFELSDVVTALFELSVVELFELSVVELFELSAVELFDQSLVELFELSFVELFDQSLVELFELSVEAVEPPAAAFCPALAPLLGSAVCATAGAAISSAATEQER